MKRLSILLVDDDNAVRDVYAHALTAAGHNVTSAAQGREAIELMGTRQFDVILTDIIMPEVDGLAVIMEAKRSQPRARIIAMTGGSEQLEAGLCLRLAESFGGHRRLIKPFTLEALLLALE